MPLDRNPGTDGTFSSFAKLAEPTQSDARRAFCHKRRCDPGNWETFRLSPGFVPGFPSGFPARMGR